MAGEAEVKYLDGDFRVMRPGAFVRCAVTGTPIPLEELKYWSVDLQEAYLSPEVVSCANTSPTGRTRTRPASSASAASPCSLAASFSVVTSVRPSPSACRQRSRASAVV